MLKQTNIRQESGIWVFAFKRGLRLPGSGFELIRYVCSKAEARQMAFPKSMSAVSAQDERNPTPLAGAVQFYVDDETSGREFLPGCTNQEVNRQSPKLS